MNIKYIVRFVKEKSIQDDLVGFPHALRVENNVIQLARHYGGDKNIVIVAALLHDVAFNWFNGSTHSIESAEMAREFLITLQYPKSKIDKICRVILLHEPKVWRKFGNPEHLEEKILFDADRTDLFSKKWIIKMAQIGSKNDISSRRIITNIEQVAVHSFDNLYFDLSKKMCRANFKFILKFIEDVRNELRQH